MLRFFIFVQQPSKPIEHSVKNEKSQKEIDAYSRMKFKQTKEKKYLMIKLKTKKLNKEFGKKKGKA